MLSRAVRVGVGKPRSQGSCFLFSVIVWQRSAPDDGGMETMNLDRAWTALASGEWEAAKAGFEAAVEGDPSPEVIDGLGRAMWWLQDVSAAIEVRTTAYSAYREANKLEEAARVAVWLSRELRTLFGNDAAANGCIARRDHRVGSASMRNEKKGTSV